MTPTTYIAVDIGTSFIKAAVLDVGQMRVAHIRRRPFPEPLGGLPPLFIEIDPRQIVAAVRTLIEQLLPTAPNCGGILMCGQQGGMVLCDPAGRPLTNYLSWRDQRLLMRPPGGAGSYFDEMMGQLTPVQLGQLGHELKTGNAISHLYWLKHAGQASLAGAIAANLPDFVIANLCDAPPAIDPTLGNGTVNLETMDWHYEALARLGLEVVGWPQLRSFREPVGQLRIGDVGLPCYGPVGDHPCALAGSLLAEHELSLNISTGSQVSLLTDALALGVYQTRPYFDGRFLNTITHIPAGRALNVLVGLVSELGEAQGHPVDDPWPVIQRAVSAVTETDLTVDLAFFPSPVGDEGAITHIREGNLTLGQLFYAAFRAMADNYSTMAQRLSPGKEWQSLVFSGGVAQKLEVLRRLILAQFDCPYRVCPWPEDTLIGLMTLALVVGGRAPSVAAATENLRQLDKLTIEEIE